MSKYFKILYKEQECKRLIPERIDKVDNKTTSLRY